MPPVNGPFVPLPAHVDLPKAEQETLRRWREQKVFERTLEQTSEGPRWIFYEGPPTANGMPGAHHVEARVFKDLFPRFKTMKGYHVPRKAGWDCHGLPVELAVEQELKLSGKKEIESYGIAEFNARCRESVERHVDAFEYMTERMGYWVDMTQAYRTMDADYIESVWWSLKQIYDKGLLVEDYRVTPYCPRCGTGLSDHEVAQGYETVADPSVYVRLPIISGPWSSKADLLVWTTTPWTLVSNTAVAVHPDVSYVVVRTSQGTFVVADELREHALGEAGEVLAEMSGKQLEHVRYKPPFDLVEMADAHYVILADYVTTKDGTGLVHQAPAFGADDLAATREYGLPVVNPVNADGRFRDDLPLVGGEFFKAADSRLVDYLRDRNLLLRHMTYEHAYPHCWRCHTPLLYYALPSWYIRTSLVKDALLRENERTRWYPSTIKHGRFGDWLANNVDWALSRDRYWGTPLPIWRCSEDHDTCVGSRAELSALAGRDVSNLDPHRPYVDEVTFDCPRCGATARRITAVIDGWYDSGSMPFAQWGVPLHNQAEFTAAYPAQFICEAIDQTRGWFYTLMAVGTIIFDRSAYETVVCLGHLLAEDGRKMSKHLGNVLEPIPLMERHSADTVRWFMLCSGSPWSARRIGHAALEEITRKVLLTYWNTASFFTLYAAANGFDPRRDTAPLYSVRPLLDRWILAELESTVSEVDSSLEGFDPTKAGRRISRFIDDLSNWYVRRSRRRFWDGEPAAMHTLYDCLNILTRLMAPFVPFVTDTAWRALYADILPTAPDSVHLAQWPTSDPTRRDEALRGGMDLVRRLVELGRSARAESGVKTRQPLARALISAPGWNELSSELRTQIADELNVGQLATLGNSGDLVNIEAKPNFRVLGKRFAGQTKAVAAAITSAEAAQLASEMRTRGHAYVVVGDDTITLSTEEVIFTESPRSGWAVSSEAGETVALDITITPDLYRAGLAREVVRLVQEARKASGFDVTDRIKMAWQATDEVAEAMKEHKDFIAGEVLATTMDMVALDDEPSGHYPELSLTLWLRKIE